MLNGDLQAALRPHGLFWPPDPTSAPYCSIGGNIACNAGGPRAVKYGATRDNVLALTAVAGHGELLRFGAATSKASTGYDLSRLLIGSEGTLALIVEATLRLVPVAPQRRVLRPVALPIVDESAPAFGGPRAIGLALFTDYMLVTNNDAFLKANPEDTQGYNVDWEARLWTDQDHNLFEILDRN